MLKIKEELFNKEGSFKSYVNNLLSASKDCNTYVIGDIHNVRAGKGISKSKVYVDVYNKGVSGVTLTIDLSTYKITGAKTIGHYPKSDADSMINVAYHIFYTYILNGLYEVDGTNAAKQKEEESAQRLIDMELEAKMSIRNELDENGTTIAANYTIEEYVNKVLADNEELATIEDIKETLTNCIVRRAKRLELTFLEVSKQTKETNKLNIDTILVNTNNTSVITKEYIEAYEKGYTIVCSQRPLNGLVTWTSNTVGNGIYYAAGNTNEYYSENWASLDAKIVKPITNKEASELIIKEMIKEGETLESMMSYLALTEQELYNELSESLNIPYVLLEDTQEDNILSVSKSEVNEHKESESINKKVYNTNTTYQLYKNTFNTYNDAYDHAITNQMKTIMILDTNHETMSYKRLQELESMYIFSLHKMTLDELKEYFNHIGSLPHDLDQEERYYKLRDRIANRERQLASIEHTKQMNIYMSLSTDIMLKDMYKKGMTKKEYASGVWYYLNGEKIYSWFSGITIEKMHDELSEVYTQHFINDSNSNIKTA